MSIASLADLVLREPALAAAMDDAKNGAATLDLTGPQALRPFMGGVDVLKPVHE